MCQTQREDEEMAGEEKIEASGEAIVLADALYAGLERIALAIEYHGRVTAGDDPSEDEPPAHYIDGSPIR